MRSSPARGLTDDRQWVGYRIRDDELQPLFRKSRHPIILADAGADQRMKKQPGSENTRGWIGIPLVAYDTTIGIIQAGSRMAGAFSEDQAGLLQTFANEAALAIENARLFEAEQKRRMENGRLLDELQLYNLELSMAYDVTLEGWGRALEMREKEAQGHTRRVTDLTLRLARRMGIDDDALTNIRRGVLLHDIGKMGIPDQILNKNGNLSESEQLEMQKHPQYAYDLIYPILFLRPAIEIPYCHHERWDGSGYPRGLKGEQIPLSARIFCSGGCLGHAAAR